MFLAVLTFIFYPAAGFGRYCVRGFKLANGLEADFTAKIKRSKKFKKNPRDNYFADCEGWFFFFYLSGTWSGTHLNRPRYSQVATDMIYYDSYQFLLRLLCTNDSNLKTVCMSTNINLSSFPRVLCSTKRTDWCTEKTDLFTLFSFKCKNFDVCWR